MKSLCAGSWMNFTNAQGGGKYRADEIFYRIGKVIWLPFLIAGFWFACYGYERYGELAECGIRKICGLPCPGCGGTRAFYYLFRGEVGKSFRLNPTVLFGVLAYLHFMLLCFFRKHLLRNFQKKEIHIPYYLYAAIAVILTQWAVKIIRIITLLNEAALR